MVINSKTSKRPLTTYLLKRLIWQKTFIMMNFTINYLHLPYFSVRVFPMLPMCENNFLQGLLYDPLHSNKTTRSVHMWKQSQLTGGLTVLYTQPCEWNYIKPAYAPVWTGSDTDSWVCHQPRVSRLLSIIPCCHHGKPTGCCYDKQCY